MIIEEGDLKEGELPLNSIIHGNTLTVLKKLPSESVDCVVTSPPYWGLRDYGEGANTVWGGDPNCEHEWVITIKKDPMDRGGTGTHDAPRDREGMKHGKKWEMKGFREGFCKKCGAWYGQLGLEPSLDMYIEHLLEIMRELKRVLKKTGVIFWNHGDNYSTSPPGNKKENWEKWAKEGDGLIGRLAKRNSYGSAVMKTDIPQKCMCLQNFRFIIRCVDELGLILRNVIIWHKPNHMPSSVKDRFTSAYEPVFMLVKSKKYWFDLDAVRVPQKPESLAMAGKQRGRKEGYPGNWATFPKEQKPHPLGKNPGDVWAIPTQPFPEAHFAVYPEKLVEPMIKAACPQEICKKCGKPRERIVERGEFVRTGGKRVKDTPAVSERQKREGTGYHQLFMVGWTDCGCNAGWESGVVLDPLSWQWNNRISRPETRKEIRGNRNQPRILRDGVAKN